MSRMIFFIFLFLFNFLYAVSQTQNISDCKSCHDIEEFDTVNHNFDCIDCHIEPKNKENFTHYDIITHPASMEHVETFCLNCHEQHILKFKNSNHYTHSNEINTIFKTFGLDRNYTIQTLPDLPQTISSKEDFLIDMLRRKCLKCHIENNDKIYESYSYHGKGCMSCHTVYNSEGRYKGKDKNMRNKKPFAIKHKMQKPNQTMCLSCHNKNFIGTDYIGLFPKDFDKAYRAPLTKDGKYPLKIYGTDFHNLTKDIHYISGMDCVDCHKKENLFNDKKIQCSSCHEIKESPAHAKYHDNLSCISCHASWQMSNYELSLLRDDTGNYAQWKNLTQQEDGYLEYFLNYVFENNITIKPQAPDYINGSIKKGLWYSGWTMRRWEHLLLGNDKNGTIGILRPIFQYRISYKNNNGDMVFNNMNEEDGLKFEAFKIYTPHTVSKQPKSCETCHEHALNLKTFKADGVMELFHGKILDGFELGSEQLNRLRSNIYKKERAKMLFNQTNSKD